VLEELGTYDPSVTNVDARAVFNGERIQYWLGVGAQPSEKAHVLIQKYGADGTRLDEQRAALEALARPRPIPHPGPPASVPAAASSAASPTATATAAEPVENTGASAAPSEPVVNGGAAPQAAVEASPAETNPAETGPAEASDTNEPQKAEGENAG